MKRAIHWFRRDLRITDNTALAHCADEAEEVVCVYVVSDWKTSHRWTGSHRQEFLAGCLASLAANLEAIGGRLVVRQGEACEELMRLARETGAEALFFNRDPDPFGRAVEHRLTGEADRAGIRVIACKDVCLHERDEVLTAAGEPFRVFTPYSRAWAKLPKTRMGARLGALTSPGDVGGGSLPTLATWGLEGGGDIVEAGEKAARARLKRFLAGPLSRYGADRDFPGQGATSRLSQDLRWGLLSIREVWTRCQEQMAELPAAPRSHAAKYVSELIWREFYMNILWHWPEVLEVEFNPKFRGMSWPGRPDHFARWASGETGFPIVDAAMRELNATGFMHNRARMIAAMFLTKDLHLDWRLGESYFMRQLTDGEIASNNGGWQWSAGTGADAAPYFRIQNPWSQTKRYDPSGTYIRKWVPELRDVATEFFCEPPAEGSIAPGYPEPMVDHAWAREKTLALFAEQKSAAA